MKKQLVLVSLMAIVASLIINQPSDARQDQIDQILKIEVTVINDHGGRATGETFDIQLTLQDPSKGRFAPFEKNTLEGNGELLSAWSPDVPVYPIEGEIGVGAYSVSISGPSDVANLYTYTYSDGCRGFMQASPITCRIIANDKPVKLTIRKVVTGSTTYAPADFTMNLMHAELGSDAGYTVFREYPGSTEGVTVEIPAVPYLVYETADQIYGFEVSSSSGCLGRASTPPEIGDEITCIISNRKTGSLYFKVIGIQMGGCGYDEIFWDPAWMRFSVPATPGTDGEINVDVLPDGSGYTLRGDNWAFNYGDIILPRVGNSRGRFGVRITGLTDGAHVLDFPHNAYHEWRITPLSTDFLLGRYDGFLEGECEGRIYFAILRNAPSPHSIRLQMAQIQARKKEQMEDSETPQEYIPLDLEDMVFAVAAAQRNLYTSVSFEITDGSAYQGLFTIDPTSDEWVNRIAWIEGTVQSSSEDDGLPEDTTIGEDSVSSE